MIAVHESSWTPWEGVLRVNSMVREAGYCGRKVDGVS